MELYFELLKKPVFSIADAEQFYKTKESARTAVKRLISQGLVKKIRNNLYTCISGETDAPVANKYQIASAITETACVSHHTALEYYGFSDQVIYDVYVASESAFHSFEFDGYTYICVKSKLKDGIETVQYSGGIRITDRERTLIDCLKDMDRIGGMEETLAAVSMMNRLNEKKLLFYLDKYDNQFLFQKAGYLLQPFSKPLGLSEDFFRACKAKIGRSRRYLTKDFMQGSYVKEWQLIVPDSLYVLKNGVEVGNDRV